jgi:phosphatidate cytidylyltransferase
VIFERELLLLWGWTLGLLAFATVVGWVMARRATSENSRAGINNLNARIRAWWLMAAIFTAAFALGHIGVIVLFGLISFLALREFLTLTPTRYGDHRALFWSFFIITPLQYYILAIPWYGLFTVFIPVYVFLLLPTRVAATGDTERFLERTAKIQWGLMICVYCVSHAPAMLTLLEIPDYQGENAKLLFYFVLICELSDVMQYVFGKLFGRHPMAPLVSPKKTWEGTIGGVLSTVGIGTMLAWATPFTPFQAAGMCLAITLCGVAGGLVMSAIKRDRGVKDWGTSIEGHGGILDRIDSLCFAAPVFFHLTRYYFTL